MVARNKIQIERLKKAGSATARLLVELAELAQPGVTTRELDDHAADFIRQLGAEPVFHTQNKFPGCINTSLNDEAVHGVPGSRVLQEGDLLSIDCGMRLNGYCGDATITLGIGDPEQLSDTRRHLRDVACEALRRGIDAARPGNHVGDIGHAMQSYVEAEGFHLLAEYTGHGLGSRLWENPHIPAVGKPGTGPRLVDGLVITIEPIVVAGKPKVYVGDDGWTVLTSDGQPAAQFEHTILLTPRGAQVLTAA